jgi:GT2 family glycosyltransferase
MSLDPLSVVIPTFQRERVLTETITYLRGLQPGPAEIVVVDQTLEHVPDTHNALAELASAQEIRWIHLPRPSITHAMNVGLEQARYAVVLFIDDDIIPGPDLLSAHARAHATRDCNIVAGQVLQPGEEPIGEEPGGSGFRFCSNRRGYISELMGGNFSIKRKVALDLGGFDENFVHVAYRFESEFASRALSAGEKIWFEPEASIRHLKASSGGTRSYGEHLTTFKPSHSVGAYYYLLRSKGIPRRSFKILARPLRAIKTRHHLSHPWWIPATLFAEISGLVWAVALALHGPRLIEAKELNAKGLRAGT